MEKYIEKALELHSKGYNCAQSVVCAFEDKMDVDCNLMYKVSEGFGAGMGNAKNVCGALSGAVMLAGLFESNGDTEHSSKAYTYKKSAKITDLFREKCGAVDCCDIKGMKTGKPTASCSECIKVAVESVGEVLFSK